MKKLRIFFVCFVVLLCAVLLCSCSDDNTSTTQPAKTTQPGGTTDKWSGKDFGGNTIKLQLSEYTDSEFNSGGKKYMQGPDNSSSDRVQNIVYTRNENAKTELNLNVNYYYINKGWSLAAPEIINTESGGSDCPDMYCDMIYDMMIATMSGCFRNLYTMTTDSGKGNFDFTEDNGYLPEFMQGLSMSRDKMYLIGSRYYMDIVRAMMVMPVNLDMYESKYGDISQFYQDIIDGKWTWDYLMNVSKNVYNDKTGDGNSIDDILGFAAETATGMGASGIVYSTALEIVDTEVQSDGSYAFSYKSDNPELIKIFTKIAEVFSTDGVLAVKSTGDQVGSIRDKFASGSLVFGGCIMMGSVEAETYQAMDQSFGLIPIPKIAEGEEYRYNTLIHNVGKCGAISLHTQRPEAVSAYIQYCTENSAELMNEYYNYAMKYKYTSDAGTAEMLDMIYENIVSIREKALEDIIASQNTQAGAYRWHLLLISDSKDFKTNADQIGTVYTTAIQIKQAVLENLREKWKSLP